MNAKDACENHLSLLMSRLKERFGECKVAYIPGGLARLCITRDADASSLVTYYINDDGSWNVIDSPDSVDDVVYDWVAETTSSSSSSTN